MEKRKYKHRKNKYCKEVIHDENDNMTYYEDLQGNYVRRTYDENNNLTKVEDSRGIIEEYTYDNNNNLITHKRNNSYCETRKYDSNNRCILSTIVQEYTYDD